MASYAEQIQALKKECNAIILAHTYQTGDIQDIADVVGDSYALAVAATKASAEIIIFCGVHFMAETAALLNPSAKVIMPAPDAGCPMADMINAEDVRKLKAQYPGYAVLCYVNSSIEVKAESTACLTSSNAKIVTDSIPEGQGILFIPDKHLGDHIAQITDREIICSDGYCPVHHQLKPELIASARLENPDAIVMVHPECERSVRENADKVFSTGQMVNYAKNKKEPSTFIIGTERGILYTLAQDAPIHTYISLSDALVCPNMKKTKIENVLGALKGEGAEITVSDPEIRKGATKAINAMLSACGDL